MKYYIIYLLKGKVVDITSWDEEEARDRQFQFDSPKVIFPAIFDEIQKLNQIR